MGWEVVVEQSLERGGRTKLDDNTEWQKVQLSEEKSKLIQS